MGQLILDRLPPGARRALPFVAALALGLVAWQMPVLAERTDAEQGEFETTAQLGTPAPSSTSTTTEIASADGLDGSASFDIPDIVDSTQASDFGSFAPPPITPSTTIARAAGSASSGPERPAPARTTGPLRITKSTWGQNTLQRGTPADSVPEGVLPVELASYIPSRQSYIEVRGTSPVITLPLADESSPPDASDPVVIACEITTRFWTDSSPGSSFEESPQYDPESCAGGVANPDGSWTFDLSAFGDLSDHPGFALIPVADETLGTYSVWYDDPMAS